MIVCAVPRSSPAGGIGSAPGVRLARRLIEMGEPASAVVLASGAEDREPAGVPLTVVDFQSVTLTGYWNGEGVSEADADRYFDVLVEAARGAAWVVLSGGLPRGMPLYAFQEVIPALRDVGARLGVLLRGEVLGATLVADPDLCIVEASEAALALGTDVSGVSGAALAATRFRAGADRTAIVVAVDGIGVSDAQRDSWMIAGAEFEPISLAATLLVGDVRHDDLWALVPGAKT